MTTRQQAWSAISLGLGRGSAAARGQKLWWVVGFNDRQKLGCNVEYAPEEAYLSTLP